MLRARYEPSLRYIFQSDTSSTCVESLRDSANSIVDLRVTKRRSSERKGKRKEKKRNVSSKIGHNFKN
jgi:hypothetical protein